MYLSGLGTAVPPLRISQTECWDAFQRSPELAKLDSRSQILLRRVLLGQNGIATRHIAVAELDEAFVLTPDALHGRFAQHAPRLATEAAQRALVAARLTSADIDAVLISTCTGYLCPGLTSYVSENLGLRPDVLALELVGQGCGAALPNGRTAEALLTAGRARHVLCICVEICSAAFFLANDPGVLISACLFGDGAAAAVWSAAPAEHARRVEWITASSAHSPADRDELRFEHHGGLLRNVLTRAVPALAARHAAQVLDDVLRVAAIEQAEITGWILHAGGREVLSALQSQMKLQATDLRWSAGILNDYGNLSSPFVYFVLQQALSETAPGGWWWLSSFGAGFSCHGALLKVD